MTNDEPDTPAPRDVVTQLARSISDAVAELSDDERDRLWSQISPPVAAPWQRQRRKLDARDGAVRELGRLYPERDRAGAMEKDLRRFADCGYKSPGTGESEKEATMRRVLDASKGRVLERRQYRNVLRGRRTPGK